MAIKHLVLSALASGPASGYRIGVRLASRAGGGKPVESARVYAALAELERAGAVEARESRREDGRSLRLFHLTEGGRGELDRWLEQPVAAAEWLRRPLLAKLAIAAAMGRLAARTLAADLAVRRRALARLAASDGDGGGTGPFERRARDRLRRHVELEVALLEALLERVRDRCPLSSPRTQPPAASGSR